MTQEPLLSVVVPARNEEGSIGSTVELLDRELAEHGVPHEVLIVNDGSTDRTEEVVRSLCDRHASVRCVNNGPPNGFGLAVRCGLENYRGHAVAIFMGDGSDSPADLVRFYRRLADGYDCVFGTRWSQGGTTRNYPAAKRALNRLANRFIQVLFRTRYDDMTNAFKLYSRDTIDGCRPFLSHHFNLTVELPLKAIVRGYRFAVLPNTWTGRATGESKLRIKEMGSRYLFIVVYCLLERWLARGDYHRANRSNWDTLPSKVDSDGMARKRV